MPFDRRVQVDIGRANSQVALRVEGLRIVLDVQKDTKTTANKARIQIYNLAASTRARIQELKDEVILRAGYADESLDEVFRGDILSVSHLKQDGDVITSIEANDGQTAMRDSFSSFSFAEGVSMKRVLEDAARSLGLPLKSVDFLKNIPDQKFLQGFSFHGKGVDVLEKLTARAGLEWSVQGHQVQIIPRGGTIPQAASQIPVLSPEQGLIGSPERLLRAEGDSPEKKPPGWRIKSLLIGRLEPGGQVGLQSEAEPKPKAFRIQSVQHKGDTHGEEFVTITEAIEPGILLNVAGG